MTEKINQKISNGVMLNAYPDSIGNKLSDTIKMLQLPEFKDVFSLFYVLPTFFNSDLDRGFSVIDYNLNKDLVSKDDLKALDELNILLKFDIVLNHLSVASPQFKDLLENGENSKYKDFFIDWNTFWKGKGILNNNIVIPNKEFLDKLFMRKSGLPILNVQFPDGSEKPYWNTFYQEIKFNTIEKEDLKVIEGLSAKNALLICEKVNFAIKNNLELKTFNFNELEQYKAATLNILYKNRSYLGQMDVNAKSELVWDFYEETLAKVKSFGCKILRLDAFAYLHKEIGQTNFFNKPGTWNYLERINQIAKKNDLILLPEIHAEYGLQLHDEVAKENYQIYDFFLPGLMIHTLETGNNKALLTWINEIINKGYKTINMLGCHDGIPVLDLKGKEVDGNYNKGLLEDKEIESIMNTIMDRGGRVKNLYDPSGKKLSYYQVNATFFSALGEVEQKLLLARAIQMFMPGIPQVWYLDLFAGTNNYVAADKAGSAGHKEINRTSLSKEEIEQGLQKKVVKNQLKIMRLRNTLKAFSGQINIREVSTNKLSILWLNKNSSAQLEANLETFIFSISYEEDNEKVKLNF
ncbi:glycosidase [Polaribacter sp.]|jgi:sucrose phosphorylase|nr:glycosidase [Polaribacter sp.]MDC1465945.1 glycosidase [Polaribacter sp.]|tara:strand:+ start:175 stop:1911 length:1737 start_codon:yes stop_codon:yes gene_type:complete